MVQNQDHMEFVYDMDVSEEDNFTRFTRYCIAHRELQQLFWGGEEPPLEEETLRYLFDRLKKSFPRKTNRVIH